MMFVSTEISGEGDDWQASGEITLNGFTRPIAFDVESNGVEAFPRRDMRLAGFSATGLLRRGEFGIDVGMLPLSADKLALSDEVKIELDLEYVEPRDD